ncbi:ABC transporter permease [Flavilitoribacter nigricans]|uniref:ABC transporter permease n=1 Tax=Flavilitoribacter nigricans (strain ATCC 23147 / DSM 23189 / NBRC 102662 / NCIMB 1420 / SS-2) TaxID=1122177 RepID=A0A2D0N0R4_FLAN2|nr:ABC transporter permease [Flavilitoribacter nigricans]PHN01956.1 hypothetical protein CRP01_34760 [Flavilitoribacter nigricans DSM 23189 = NBRC 102662]
MWLNYLKIAWRNLKKYKFFSSLNIGGLAIGMAVAILITSYIQNELQVNQWVPDGSNIYRAYRYFAGSSSDGQANSPGILATELNRQFPAIEQATTLGEESDQLLTAADKSIYLDEVAFVDSNFLNVFALPFLHGNRQDAFQHPESAVISETTARRFFGQTDVIGKTLVLNDEVNLNITGVYPELSGKTHLDYDIFIRSTSQQMSWLAYRYETYVKTVPNTQLAGLEEQVTEHLKPILLQEFQRANFEITANDLPLWKLQPLHDIHLYSRNMGAIRPARGNIHYLYIFGFIGLLVLIMAAINYINLSTARAGNRAQEIGVRKVNGALKQQLVAQFLTESVFQSILAALIAFPLARLVLPLFNEVSGRELTLAGAQLTGILLPFLGISLLVGLLAGIYPALVLSGFQPTQVFKAGQNVRMGHQVLRKALVVVQFSGVVILIILTTVMYRQVRFMLNQDLGFGAEEVVVVPMNYSGSWREVMAKKELWEKQPGITSVSTASTFPGDSPVDYTIEIEGLDDRYRAPEMIFADADYAEVLDLQLVDGRFFSNTISNDTLTAFVVNQAFVREYELETPVGTRLRFPWREGWGEIVGVVKDYHYQGLDNRIEPVALFGGPISRGQFAIRFQPDQWSEVLSFLRSEWPTIEPAHPFRYNLLNEHFATQYAEYNQMGSTFLYSAGLTILVAVLGLIGLASFTAQQRTKEIGIRKVLGASVPELMSMLMRQFVAMSLIAGLVSIPLAFWLTQSWLEDFAYRVDLNIWHFVIGILLAVTITILTVSLQSLRAAMVNPLESLRSE